MSLGKDLVRGVLSIGILNVVRYGLLLGIQIVLARLLTPEIFGTVALAAAILTLIGLAGRWGTKEAIMQEPEETVLFSTVFWLRTAFALVLFVVVVVLSIPLRAIYSETVASVLVVLAAPKLFFTVCSLFEAELQRQIDLPRIGIVDLVAVVLSGALAIGLALRDPTVWSLLAFYASKAALRGVGYLLLSPTYPSLAFDWETAKWFAGFARGMILSKVLKFAEFDADDYLVGTIGGASMLGAYSVAWRLAHGFVIGVFSSIRTGMLPAFAKVRDDDEKSRRGLEFLTRMQLHMTVPGYVFAAIAAPELILLVFGPKWETAIPALRALALAGILFPILETGTEFYYARGEARKVVRMQVVFLIVLVVSMVALISPLGVLGAGLSADTAAFVGCVIIVARLARDVDFSPRAAFGAPLVAGVIAIVAGVTCRVVVSGAISSALVSLLTYGIIVGIPYYLSLYVVGGERFSADIRTLRDNLVGDGSFSSSGKS